MKIHELKTILMSLEALSPEADIYVVTPDAEYPLEVKKVEVGCLYNDDTGFVALKDCDETYRNWEINAVCLVAEY